MTTEQTKRLARKPRTKKAPDHRKELHTRLDRFLDNATNPATLDSLVSGLVDYELGVRLAGLDETGNE
jgi:hypothetical protein